MTMAYSQFGRTTRQAGRSISVQQRIEDKVHRARLARKRAARAQKASRYHARPRYMARRGNWIGRRNRFSSRSWR